jgi:hypothetical protein
MKRILLAALVLLPFPLLCQDYNIIPYPSEIEKKEGLFILDTGTVITHSQELKPLSNQLKAYLDPGSVRGRVVKRSNQELGGILWAPGSPL